MWCPSEIRLVRCIIVSTDNLSVLKKIIFSSESRWNPSHTSSDKLQHGYKAVAKFLLLLLINLHLLILGDDKFWRFSMKFISMIMISLWDHPFSTYAKFSEKLTFLTPWYTHVRVRIRGSEMLVFRITLRTY